MTTDNGEGNHPHPPQMQTHIRMCSRCGRTLEGCTAIGRCDRYDASQPRDTFAEADRFRKACQDIGVNAEDLLAAMPTGARVSEFKSNWGEAVGSTEEMGECPLCGTRPYPAGVVCSRCRHDAWQARFDEPIWLRVARWLVR